jgi:hypothetical protein
MDKRMLAAVLLVVAALACWFLRPKMREGVEDATASTTESATAPVEEPTEPTSSAEPPAAPPSSYEAYSTSDPAILAQQNAGNIGFLKERVTALDQSDKRISRLEEDTELMQSQIDALVEQQATYATELTGTDQPVEVTGL